MLFRRLKTQPLVEAFLDAKRAKGLSPKTIDNYHWLLGAFARTFPTLPLSPEPIQGFLATKGPTPETRDTYFCVLRVLYRWLNARNMVNANPMAVIERPTIPHKLARSLSEQELSQLFHAGQPYQVRAFLLFLMDAGIRLSEALSVNSADCIGLETAMVNGKTGQREVPLSPLVRVAVLNALPWPWKRPDSASSAMRKAFRRAGLSGKRASAHTLRHTFARLWDGDETILQGILGHSSPRMIRQVYRPYNVARAIKQHGRNSPLNRI